MRTTIVIVVIKKFEKLYYTDNKENAKEDIRILENFKKRPDPLLCKFLPSQEQMLALLVTSLSFVLGDSPTNLFKKTFCEAVTRKKGCYQHNPCDARLCGTTMLFIEFNLHNYKIIVMIS